MHFDFTVRFWPMVASATQLIALGTFLRVVYKLIKGVVDKINLLIDQHHEVYSWYRVQTGKTKPNGSALGTGA